MNVSIAAVMSLDGKLTRHHEPNIYAWVSKEDQQNFRSLIAAHEVIIIGRGTYESMQDNLRPAAEKLRVVLTTHPERFTSKAVPGQLEFISSEPSQLVALLESRGFNGVLIVGGHQIISSFLTAKLVNKLYLTIEPRLFGDGQPLTDDFSLDIELKLEEHQKLNDQGTLLLTYKVMSKA